jgi:hypothetical protein
MKKIVIIISALVLFFDSYGQSLVIESDTLVIHKIFSDKNGNNNLEITVLNPCGEIKSDGWENYITVRLHNKNYSDTLTYSNPNYEMTLINLVENNIVLKLIAGKQAVFIPFAYCGTADDDKQIAYIVFYNHKATIHHINLRGEDFNNYKIVDNLDEKLRKIPKKLRKELIKHIQENVVRINSQ